MSDFSLTAEQVALREMARDFGRETLLPRHVEAVAGVAP